MSGAQESQSRVASRNPVAAHFTEPHQSQQAISLHALSLSGSISQVSDLVAALGALAEASVTATDEHGATPLHMCAASQSSVASSRYTPPLPTVLDLDWLYAAA